MTFVVAVIAAGLGYLVGNAVGWSQAKQMPNWHDGAVCGGTYRHNCPEDHHWK